MRTKRLSVEGCVTTANTMEFVSSATAAKDVTSIPTKPLRHVVHTFPPVIDRECRILILGSVPSVKSVERNFYFMHPKNRFWFVMQDILNEPFTILTAEGKTAALLKHKIALYDVVYECDILGSSDAAVKNVTPTDLAELMRKSKIEHIVCNGKLSYNLLLKYNPQLSAIACCAPSTSPANARYGFEVLLSEWSKCTDAHRRKYE